MEHFRKKPYTKQLKCNGFTIPIKDFYLFFRIFSCGQHKDLTELSTCKTTFTGWWEMTASSHRCSQKLKDRVITNLSAGSSVGVLVQVWLFWSAVWSALPPQWEHTHDLSNPRTCRHNWELTRVSDVEDRAESKHAHLHSCCHCHYNFCLLT